MKRLVVAALLGLSLVAGKVLADEALKSGPQVNQEVPGPFHPLNINGAKAGEKHCLYCENGSKPVAMIFAREPSKQLTQLIKKIDAANAEKGEKMGSFVVFLSDNPKLEARLKKMAEKQELKKTVLSIDNPAGPQGYEVAKDADVTVVLYTNRKVKANHAFKKGELNEQAIEKIVSDVPKILPKE